MNAGPEEIAHAVERLARGGLVAFPTETVYGLGADATDAQAVGRVFAAKGRPANNPLIVHVSGVEMARTVVAAWPPIADRLAAAFWPGPLSLILPKASHIPGIVTGGGPNVAVRCPDHATTLSLLFAFGRPLVGPSANPSGRVSPTRAEHVREAFPPELVDVLDGGPCRGGIESTVVSLVGEPTILRPGLIGPAELSKAAGVPIVQSTHDHTSHAPAASPGLLAQHYAPVTPAFLFSPSQRGTVEARLGSGQAGVALVIDGDDLPPPHRTIRMPREASAYASQLYAALREADAANAAAIFVEQPPATSELWTAITDRLRRATVPFDARPH